MRRLGLTALRLAIRTLPPVHRRRFGSEMSDVFAAQWQEQAREPGLSPRLRLAARACVDVLRTALSMRLGGGAQPPAKVPQRPGGDFVGGVAQDLRYALRGLISRPAFTAAVVVTLALGIGANAAVFGLVDALLLRDPPAVSEPERVLALFSGEGGFFGVSSYLDFRDFEEQVGAFAQMAAYKPLAMDLSAGDAAERTRGLLVTGDYFELLGVAPHLGRLLGPADDLEPGGHTSVVLSWSAWRARFAADPEIVGRVIRLNGAEFTVIGVAPRGFEGTSLGGERIELFAPMMMQGHFMPGAGYLLDRRGWSGVLVLGRLAEGATPTVARAEVDRVGTWLRETYPREVGDREWSMVPLHEANLGPEMRGTVSRAGLLLLAVTGTVLLVACVNVANLLIGRAAERQRELAIRQALGAGRGRVTRQLLVEALLLSVLGGGLGFALAHWVVTTFELLPLQLPDGAATDPRVIGFTAGLTLLAASLFGVFPALGSTGVDLVTRLREGGGSRHAAGRRPLVSALVVGQVALSMLLTLVAGLLARSLIELRSVDLGFEPRGVAVMTVDPALQGYAGETVGALYQQLLGRVSALPGVQSASLASVLPGPGDGDTTSAHVEGTAADARLRLGYTVVGADYLRTLGIAIERGRDFTPSDATSSTLVVVANPAAERLVGREHGLELLGRSVGPEGPDGPRFEVIGITAASATGAIGEEPAPMIYLLVNQVRGMVPGRLTLLARTAGDPAELAPVLRRELAALAPTVPAFGVGTLESRLADSLDQERALAITVAVAAGVALVLALVGLYGVLTHAVTRRTREMGLRLALGARHDHLQWLVIGQGLRLAMTGVLLGAGAGLAAARLLGALLFAVSPTDPVLYVLVGAVLLAVAAAAAWLPARHAVRVDPVVSFRAD